MSRTLPELVLTFEGFAQASFELSRALHKPVLTLRALPKECCKVSRFAGARI